MASRTAGLANNTGSLAFNAYYENIWGDRWGELRKSLLMPAESFSCSEGLVKPYILDYASVLAASSLLLPEEGLVLDACAAPGGKSLIIASKMGEGVNLLCNELSSDRRRRLSNVLDEHLDNEKRKRVTVSGFDTAKAGGRKTEHERFDAILLDVPCSSERHVIQSEKALNEWTPARPRFLSQRQWSLLSSAFLMLKPGGCLIYSTCAINPDENDIPVSRLLGKYKNEAEIDEFKDSEEIFHKSETAKYGRLILPDSSEGMGPIYVSRVIKNFLQ